MIALRSPAGEVAGTTGVITNVSLDLYEGKYTSAVKRVGIFAATLGTGKAIEKLGKLGKIGKIDAKILNANKLANEKVMETAKEKSEEKSEKN